MQLASSASASASASPVKSDRVSDGGREALSPVCEEVESEKEKKRPPPPIRQTSLFPRTQRRKTWGSEVGRSASAHPPFGGGTPPPHSKKGEREESLIV